MESLYKTTDNRMLYIRLYTVLSCRAHLSIQGLPLYINLEDMGYNAGFISFAFDTVLLVKGSVFKYNSKCMR